MIQTEIMLKAPLNQLLDFDPWVAFIFKRHSISKITNLLKIRVFQICLACILYKYIFLWAFFTKKKKLVINQCANVLLLHSRPIIPFEFDSTILTVQELSLGALGDSTDQDQTEHSVQSDCLSIWSTALILVMVEMASKHPYLDCFSLPQKKKKKGSTH